MRDGKLDEALALTPGPQALLSEALGLRTHVVLRQDLFLVSGVK
jgi:hypothetical protein